MDTPPSRIAPPAGGQIPVSARASEDFPAADAPITPTAFPGSTAKLTLCSTGSLPTEPGTYVETAEIGGNYSCSKISRNIVVY